MALRASLATAADSLLSTRTSHADHYAALSSLEHLLASLTLESAAGASALDAFLSLQDGFEYNCACGRVWLQMES